MALFQNTVVSKYLNTQDPELLSEKWEVFSSHFHDPVIQENIRNSKEEQYQEGFLRDLFVKVLGYTLNPNPGFNLTTEYKNVKDAKKADGAVIIGEDVPAVIELKGTDTTDLGTVEDQAFGYKNNQPTCKYVVISNFEKLRFYIDNAIEHLEFNLFNLTKEEFNLLYLCLAYENIKNDIPSKIKNESLSKEDEITKQLYKDYSVFKRELFQNLIEQNPEYNQVELFKKSQKLLDRFLFLFFGEDRGLLPPNSVRMILGDWKKLKELDEYRPLYERFKKYFGYLNTGFESKNYEVFAYNGGLFKPDEILDNTKIDDELLYTHTLRLSEYDFESEVDVNILGHIFEHSLNEIDEIKAQLAGEEIDKTQTKRKKDGVFYTPKYITKYIVENTVGKLCEEEKTKLGIKEEDYYTDKKRQLKTKQKLLKKLQNYRKWLHEITIIDPACGSGSFLIEALNFLIEEHSYIDEMEAKLTDSAIAFSYHPESILENNLYGVDINEESVEIAKLSLWLRTAEPNRKLSSLSHNLKCGNSLIDDPEVAGDLAFNWEKEFPKVFAKGGFDVVIGNPPYVQSHSLTEETKDYIYSRFISAEYQINTYAVFMEKTIEILKNQGVYSLIVPNYWISTKYDSKLRRLLLIDNRCFELVNIFSVFEDATVDTLVITGQKTKTPSFPKQTKIGSIDKNLKTIEERLIAFYNRIWSTNKTITTESHDEDKLISFGNTIDLNGNKVISDYLDGFQGMKPYEKGKGTPPQSREMMNNRIYNSDKKIDSEYYPLIGASNVQRYLLKNEEKYIKYGKNLAAPRDFKIFSQPRILINRILSKEKIDATYAEDTIINNTDVFNFIPVDSKAEHLKKILAVLNSRLCSYHFKSTNINLSRQAFPKLNVNNLLSFTLPDNFENSKELELFSDQMISLNKDLQIVSDKFKRTLHRKFELEKLSKKLESWYDLSFGEFIKELKKRKIKLSLSEEAEWEDYFLEEQAKALSIQSEINVTDKEIDQMVYKLYGLTEEEIEVVERG